MDAAVREQVRAEFPYYFDENGPIVIVDECKDLFLTNGAGEFLGGHLHSSLAPFLGNQPYKIRAHPRFSDDINSYNAGPVSAVVGYSSMFLCHASVTDIPVYSVASKDVVSLALSGAMNVEYMPVSEIASLSMRSRQKSIECGNKQAMDRFLSCLYAVATKA